jgi:flagellar hook protein FlgE
MLRSLFTGISGLRTHQQMMDITGNNIANVNTIGFKSSSALFQDALSQMITSASAPQAGNGGTNPAQIGLGVQMWSITTNFSQGSAQVTGRNTDMMINGDGFFVVQNKGEQMYTRAGSFSFDANGWLVNSSGMVAQGWAATKGVVDTKEVPGNVRLPISTLFPPRETNLAAFTGNLPEGTEIGKGLTTSIRTYDETGAELTLTVTFTRTATGWDIAASDGDGGHTATDTLTFNDNGATPVLGTGDPSATDPLVPGTTLIIPRAAPSGGPMRIDLAKLTGFSGQNTIAPASQDGSAMGSLSSFDISKDGLVIGVFSNGLKEVLAQLTMASFNNPPGLEKAGESVYRTSVNSGEAQLGTAGTGGRGFLQAQALEMSNVDLGQEFTNLVVAQRGFQANSKVITTADELLQELVNMKR